MGALEVASVGEVAILVALAQGLEKIAMGAIDSALGLKEVTTSTGLNIEKLQEWLNVAGHVGIESKAMASTLSGISKDLARGLIVGDFGKLRDLGTILQRSGGRALQDYAKDVNGAFELIKDLRKSTFFQGLSDREQSTLLGGSGLATIQAALQQKRMSDDQFRKWAAEGPVMSEEQVEAWNALHSDLVSIENLSLSIKEIIGEWFSEDMKFTLHELIVGLTILKDFLDKKKEHGFYADTGRRTVEYTVHPTQMVRDVYAQAKEQGGFETYLSRLIASTMNIAPPLALAGISSPRGTVHQYNSIVLKGEFGDRHTLGKTLQENLDEQHQKLAAELNR